MPSLRAPTAKRDVEYGVIEPENLQEWASAQTAGGTFMLTPNVTKGVPDTRYWRGILTVAFPGIDRGLLIFTSGEMYRTNTAAGQWTEPWRAVADCVAPEMHSLPLNIAGDINTSHYSRDQFGRVFVSIRVQPNTHWSEMKTIGTMPEGFRPDWDIVVPALVQSYGNPFRAEELFITSTGAIITQGDYSDVDLIFAQLTYPAAT